MKEINASEHADNEIQIGEGENSTKSGSVWL